MSITLPTSIIQRIRAAAAKVKPTVAVIAGLAAQGIAIGVVHGTALDIARAVLAAATILGVHVTAKAATTRPAKTRHAYGWIHSRPDTRDRVYRPVSLDTSKLPHKVDLRTSGLLPTVWDQGQLGSCTAHGTLGAFLYASNRRNIGDPMLSRLQLYYDSRALEGNTSQDAGAEVRDAIKAAAAGIAPETDWPYDISKFADTPPASAVKDAAANRAIEYEAVPVDQAHYMAALAAGFPIVDGMPVYESMETQQVAATGAVPLPRQGEQMLGGHCTLTVGYDLDADHWDGAYGPGAWIVRNSWGTGWGDGGYFYLPLAYIQLKSDAWRIDVVS